MANDKKNAKANTAKDEAKDAADNAETVESAAATVAENPLAADQAAAHGGAAKPDTEQKPEEKKPEEKKEEEPRPPAPEPEIAAPEVEIEALYTLEELAVINRVPSWQQAALHRMQDWRPGKKVTEKQYRAALDALGSRPQGGGRH